MHARKKIKSREIQQLHLKANDRQEKKQWYAIVMVKKDPSGQIKVYISLFHFDIVKLFYIQHKQSLPSATEDDVVDFLLEANDTQLKEKIDGAIITK